MTNNTATKTTSVREINSHLASCSSYCYVRSDTVQMRISRARSRAGVMEGRVINGQAKDGRRLRDWEPIAADARIELS